MCSHIEERIDELQEEKDELKQFDDLDNKRYDVQCERLNSRDEPFRRCIEYTVYTKELNSALEELKRLEGKRQEATSGELQSAHAAAAAAREVIAHPIAEMALINCTVGKGGC